MTSAVNQDDSVGLFHAPVSETFHQACALEVGLVAVCPAH